MALISCFFVDGVAQEISYTSLQNGGKIGQEKGKVLPLPADNLNSSELSPPEEAWLWRFHH